MSALPWSSRRTRPLPPLRVGIGGPVGSGKTTLLEMLCKRMREHYELIAITNDIYTREDQRLLTVAGALPPERILGVETGGCPHTAIREDASINLEAIERMLTRFPDADIVIGSPERGGSRLGMAASFPTARVVQGARGGNRSQLQPLRRCSMVATASARAESPRRHG